jgi:hypothetical protein
VRHIRYREILLAGTVAIVAACAPKQKIPLDCIPKEVVVYVDGERLDELPPELDLRSDEPHTVFVKGPGIHPELVVLSSSEVNGRMWLSPSSICIQPRLLEVRRELEFEIEPDVSAAPSDSDPEEESTTDVTPRPEFLPQSY